MIGQPDKVRRGVVRILRCIRIIDPDLQTGYFGRMLKRILTAALLLLLVGCGGRRIMVPEEGVPLDQRARTVTEKPLAPIDLSTWNRESVIISPDLEHVAWRSGGWFADQYRQWVTLDGTASSKYRAIYDPLLFSSDGSHFAYVATLDDSDFVVLDGVAQARFSFVSAGSVCFSADGARLAYFASNGDQIFAVIDGYREGPYTDVDPTSLHFSPDGRHVGYVARAGQATYVVVDGVRSSPSAFFNPGDPVFSPDSKRLAWCASDSTQTNVFIDHTAVGRFEAAHPSAIVFSPDSKRWLGAVQTDGMWSVLIDGVPEGTYDDLANLQFSPDSKRTAWFARLGDETFPVIDGARQRTPYAVGDTLVFSPNSRRVAHSALSEQAALVVADGEAGPFYQGIVTNSLVFSPDSRRLAYAAGNGRDQFVVVDGREQPAFEQIAFGPVFSPDSRHIAYVALRDNLAHIVIDQTVARLDRSLWLINGGRLFFSSPTAVRYIAEADGTFYQVTERLISP